MFVPLMGVSCGDHIDDSEESEGLLIDEKREGLSQRGVMDLQQQHHHHHHGIEIDFEFWPVEHPVEPTEEDRPVKCPMPDSSVINGGGMQEERYAEGFRKRAEQPTAASNNEGTMSEATQPLVRAVRKRHHTLTHGDDIKPTERIHPQVTLPPQTTTIFEMLQQVDKPES